MERWPRTRSNDHDLLIAVYHMLGFKMTPEQAAAFRKLPTPESVTRVRRKIQESGKYAPVAAVGDARRNKSHVMQQNAPGASPGRLSDILQDK